MPLLQLAVIGYGVVLALVLMAMVGGLAVRRARGERWEVPLEWTPDLDGTLSRPPGVRFVRVPTTQDTRDNDTDHGRLPLPSL